MLKCKFSPVLIEATTAVIAHVLSPNSEKGTETMRSVDVANHTNTHQGRSFNHSHSLHNFLLVDLWKTVDKISAMCKSNN